MAKTLTISLPDDLVAALDEQVASGLYASSDDYIQDLIRRDHLLGDRDSLERELAARSDERGAVVMDAQDLGQMRDEIERRLRSRSGQ